MVALLAGRIHETSIVLADRHSSTLPYREHSLFLTMEIRKNSSYHSYSKAQSTISRMFDKPDTGHQGGKAQCRILISAH
jgi:hypothetical protein